MIRKVRRVKTRKTLPATTIRRTPRARVTSQRPVKRKAVMAAESLSPKRAKTGMNLRKRP